MMRASGARPAFDSLRQCSAAWRARQKWPFRCTRSTASHSSSPHDTNMRSRTKPALLTTTSRRPKRSSVRCSSARVCCEVGDVGAVGDRLAAGGADLGRPPRRPAPGRRPRPPATRRGRSPRPSRPPARTRARARGRCRAPRPSRSPRARRRRPPSRLQPLEDRDVGLAAALAHGLQAVAAAVRSSSQSSVVIRRVPVAPIGWPSAIAPPFGFTFAMSGCSSFSHASTTDANASLISIASIWSSFMPVFSSAWRVAGIGAVSIRIGSSARTLRWWTRARGRRPCVLQRPLRRHQHRRRAVRDLARDARR